MDASVDNDIEELRLRIVKARAYAKEVCKTRARLAGILSGTPGVASVEFEFPEPDVMHVYSCMFDRRMGEPSVYRLSLSTPMKWVGVSHPWGLKLANIVVSSIPETTRR